MNGRDELLQAEEENEIDHEHHSGKFYFGGGFHKPTPSSYTLGSSFTPKKASAKLA